MVGPPPVVPGAYPSSSSPNLTMSKIKERDWIVGPEQSLASSSQVREELDRRAAGEDVYPYNFNVNGVSSGFFLALGIVLNISAYSLGDVV